MKQRKSVALLIETSNAYARGLLQGIIEYQKSHDAWSITLPEQDRGAVPPSWLKKWRGDGIIARIENEAIAKDLAPLNIPVVDLSSARRLTTVPWVETDDEAIANIALEHLRERGYQQFAFCGLEAFNWSQLREKHFVNACRERNYPCEIYRSRSSAEGSRSLLPMEKKRLGKWLAQLPKPTGLLAAYDIQAQIVLDVCRSHSITVPEQLAVLGVDNDPLLCDLATPSLSSVIPNAIGAGMLAAELLDSLMGDVSMVGVLTRKRKSDSLGTLLAPLGVAQRQSTDVMAVDDPDVAQAMQFIREHACDGINVEDLLREIPLSRRSLESRFRKATGKTPHEMITQRRLNRVEMLLRETDLSQEEIARRSGFEYPEYMNTLFRKQRGVSPGTYRRKLASVSRRTSGLQFNEK
jgi:LacI family transcriptional regulator